MKEVIKILHVQSWRDEAGNLHREDGPALIFPNGRQCWYIHGEYHRLDGPAVITTSGRQVWYINNFGITDEVEAWINENNFPDYTVWSDTQKVMFKLAFSGK